jgi:hypothetical protein
MSERRPAVELRLSKQGFDVLADREGLELEAYLHEIEQFLHGRYVARIDR